MNPMHKSNPRPDLSAAVNSGRPQIETQPIKPGAKSESAAREQSSVFDLARGAEAGIERGVDGAGLMVEIGRFAGEVEGFGFGFGEDFGSVRGGDGKVAVAAAGEGIGGPVVVVGGEEEFAEAGKFFADGEWAQGDFAGAELNGERFACPINGGYFGAGANV
jgi:hypothetical protein